MKRNPNASQLLAATIITAAAIASKQTALAQTPAGNVPAGSPVTSTTNSAIAAESALESNGLSRFLDERLPGVIAEGKFHINARLRYEYAEQNGVAGVTDASHAPTIRTRFGFTTAPLYGFQGMIEAEDLRVIGPEGNYNAAGSNNRNYKASIPDPPTTELNQAWLSYSCTNLLTLKAGRQRIVLDNHRFIGDVGWRQNMQTFDAVQLEVRPVDKMRLYYGYIWDVHRVFGDVSGLPAASPFHDFGSSSHLVQFGYEFCPHARFVGYSYLLDLDLNNGTASARDNSSATYGGFVTGNANVTDTLALAYRGELAWQTDHGNSALDYEALYYSVELSGNKKPFAFGAGYEVLGSGENDGAGGGRAGFRTPLATLHAFNGWADVFLNTPADGLRDLYVFAEVTLPTEVPLRVAYHKYNADHGSDDFGHEVDVIASRKFGRNWTALLKYACYMGEDAAPPALMAADVDVHKFWAQVEFNF